MQSAQAKCSGGWHLYAQVDAFQLAVETPSPQLQQRRRNAPDTPLGSVALGITDASPTATQTTAAEAAAAQDQEDAGYAGLAAEQEPASADVANAAQSSWAAAPLSPEVEEVSNTTHALAYEAITDGDDRPAAAHDEADGSVARQNDSSTASAELSLPPSSRAAPAAVQETERDPPARLSGTMALGLSRRRASMVAPAHCPVIALDARCRFPSGAETLSDTGVY